MPGPRVRIVCGSKGNAPQSVHLHLCWHATVGKSPMGRLRGGCGRLLIRLVEFITASAHPGVQPLYEARLPFQGLMEH